jgi:hypothetical protein
MHVLIFNICMIVSDYSSNPTVIILVGIGIDLTEMHVLIFNIWMTVSDYSSNPAVIILVGIGILPKCMFYWLISGWLYQTIIPIRQYLY